MKKSINKDKYGFILIVLFLVLILSIGFFAVIGTANISSIDTFRIVGSKLPIIKKYIDVSDIEKSHQTIIWSIRLPRVLLGILVGASLSMAGTAFQGIFKNPMADPYVIGISSGAALGASIAIILGVNIAFINISTISIFAFIGALGAVFTVYNIARIKNKVPVTTLLLAGIAIGQFLTAIMSFLMVIYSKDMAKIIYWTLGSLAGKGWEPLIKISIPVIISMIFINFFARDLNIMLTGEESAQSLGVDVEKTKIYILILGTFMVSMVVSIAGIIGFVGLIIPHIVRIILGPDNRIILPASAFVGGIFMVSADTIARTIISPVEIPVGIITALFGGPFFLYLLRKSKR
ncbi:iron chelate uptake ABC transporter family permease subunit [Tissierella carlieri]|jgi:iron complex transport system permease protein|uniref:FecCD family ABC transporter permease n=1 Tax=Tissierella carlieri TaxID=689904 RepID=UPI001C10A459|nr:iron chelate uptake ABC transporter family permease subunit [Tissierella carlieri]MBU5312504.1 iron chelate uptake ABC transporter family permease subunit [Tissierella carlieri]MDU5081766.1 iron chelate uptake ABC transporter family permease subunit [Bacillota bacterium]